MPALDYYPFGMRMPNRGAGGANYRYGFNGQEVGNDIKGIGNSYTAEFWEYDPRIGRRWNVDPIVKDDESPFMTFGNNPIVMIDPNGADWYKHKGFTHMKTGTWSKRNKSGFSYYFGDSKDGLIQDGPSSLAEVVVKAKKGGRNWLNLPSYNSKDVDRWTSYHAMLRDRHSLNQPLVQDGDPEEYKENFNFYQRSWQANQDWRTTNYAILEFTTFFAPVPKVGMARWFKPFGNAAGRVFWSGGGVEGRVFLEASQHAWLYGGTTLEKTLVGKTVTAIQYITGRNAMTGKLWSWASTNFAKGATGEVHVFLAPELRERAFWYTEKLFLEANKSVTEIIPHIIK